MLNQSRSFKVRLASLLLIGLFLFFQNYQAWSADSIAKHRIISLSPHLTELVYSAGAGQHLVGVSDYSDFPLQAKNLPSVGNSNAINIEAILALKPDLIIAWQSSSRPQDIAKLKAFGLNVWLTKINTLEDIPKLITKIGEQAGTTYLANQKAKELNLILNQLSLHYSHKQQITAFYEVWQNPLMTINGKQFISLGMNICGAKNAFADLPTLAAEINTESVIQRNPTVLLIGGQKAFQNDWKQQWFNYPFLDAVKNQQIYLLNNNLYQRPTARFIENLPNLCKLIDKGRK
ncbi:cobalamin-binding protein [Thiomicrorhabdus hydrogeniphila]